MKHATNWFDKGSNMRVNCKSGNDFLFFLAAFYDTRMIYLYEIKGGVYNLAPRKPSFPQILVSLSARS